MCGADDCPTCRPATCDEAILNNRIITQHILPPIPDRSHDWMACLYDRDDGPTGFGATKAEAIADLKTQLDEQE